jgi:hypothetical protein
VDFPEIERRPIGEETIIGWHELLRGLINPLNAELSTIFHLLTLLGAQPILHVSKIRVK